MITPEYLKLSWIMNYWMEWEVNHNYITKWKAGEITKSVTKDLIKSMDFWRMGKSKTRCFCFVL